MDQARKLTRGQVAAVAVGNALEFYDFLTYGFFAVQIGRAFFPSSDPTASLLASLATFGVGFLMRPVGAAVIGRLADKAGRRPAMLTSFLLMGVAMAALALIPPYSRIGSLAGLLAVACRLVQGFALGGEVGPSTAFLAEAAPAGRRGRLVALQGVSQQAAVLASGVVGFTLAHGLSDQALDAWGWRAALLVGVVIVPFGLALRTRLAETLGFAEATSPVGAAPAPGVAHMAALGLVMLAGCTTVVYLGNYMTTYATATLHMPKTLGFAATIVLGTGGIVGSLLSGRLSDRFGRKPVMIAPWSLLLVGLTPLFAILAAARSGPALLATAAVLSVANGLATCAVLAAVSEGLPLRVRGRALGLIYAVAISVFGGSTQFTVAWLTAVTHSPLAPAWYATGAVAISLSAMWAMPETAPATGS